MAVNVAGPPMQIELFEQHLPERPYCTDNFAHGLQVLPRNAAKGRLHIQPQPPWLRLWMVFDYDRDCAWCAADEAGLPAPTFTVINCRNGHGHLLYGIDTPVRMESWGGRRAPARYLADVERAMTVRLGADLSYSGFICKNPLHRHWETVSNNRPYSIGELHRWLGDLDTYTLPQRTVGLGRNVETFDAVRLWAYLAVLEHKAAGGSLETWQEACIGAAKQFTAEHHDPPLHNTECGWTGRSVSKWTWVHFTPERFSEIQAERGRGGKKVRALREERDRHIRELSESGYTQVLIARVMGVSRKTVGRVIHRVVHNGTKPYQDNSLPSGSSLLDSGGGLSPPARTTPDLPGQDPGPGPETPVAPSHPVQHQPETAPNVVGQLLENLAERRRMPERVPHHVPAPQSRMRPIDWKKLRASPDWTESQQQQMDADYERLGEDHAYHLWIERWPGRISATTHWMLKPIPAAAGWRSRASRRYQS